MELLGALHDPVDGYPRHDFGVCEMLRRAARFPDPLIRLLPDLLELFHQRALEGPGLGALGNVAEARLVKRVHDFTVDVELELLVRRVADADRFGIFVAWEPRDLPFAEQTFAAQP